MAGREPQLTPAILLAGYAQGIFPMASSREDDQLHWVDPVLRGILPLEGFHLSRSLARRLRGAPWAIRTNTDFSAVVQACADRDETWINGPLFTLYDALHRAGNAHSLEVWESDELVGGVFGISLGAAFFGESMFSRRRDASKVALAYLVAKLRGDGFRLLDTQFLTPHLESLGGVAISRVRYRALLAQALAGSASFSAEPLPSPQGTIQRITQTS